MYLRLIVGSVVGLAAFVSVVLSASQDQNSDTPLTGDAARDVRSIPEKGIGTAQLSRPREGRNPSKTAPVEPRHRKELLAKFTEGLLAQRRRHNTAQDSEKVAPQHVSGVRTNATTQRYPAHPEGTAVRKEPSAGRSHSREALEERWSTESADPSWTKETRAYLSEMIDDADINATLEDVACTTTLCRTEMSFDDLDDARRLEEFAGDPSADISVFPVLNADKFRVLVFIGRSEHKFGSISKQL